MQEKRLTDPSFELSEPVLKLLADRLTENGRELEGAVNRLYLTWQLMHTPITLDSVEAIIRDLVLGIEPRRIKVEDILRIVSRHFAVPKSEILSDRRHRSVVRPRQIGMYLAKQLTVALAARDRPPVRQSRPHHGAACHPQDRQGNGRQSAPQGRDRRTEAAAQQVTAAERRFRPPGDWGRMQRGGSGVDWRRSLLHLCGCLRLAAGRPLQIGASRSTLVSACESPQRILDFLACVKIRRHPRR